MVQQEKCGFLRSPDTNINAFRQIEYLELGLSRLTAKVAKNDVH